MFSKGTKGEAAPEAVAAPRKLVAASLIAEGVVIRGDITTDGEMQLDGAVEGDVTAGRLTIGETGAVTGTVKADIVDVRGRVSGSISARQVRLLSSARVDGDITQSELAIEAGAHFVGRSLELPPVEPAAALSIVAAE